MKTTIKDVAAAAGVSIATVSYVINGTRFGRPELIEKVKRAIIDTNYQLKSDKNVGSVKLGTHSVVAIVVPQVNSSLFPRLINGITSECLIHGYTASIYLIYDNQDTETSILSKLAGDKRIAGIIIAPSNIQNKFYKKLEKQKIPLVCIERTVSNHSISSVVADNKGIIYKGTQTLINSGHKK